MVQRVNRFHRTQFPHEFRSDDPNRFNIRVLSRIAVRIQSMTSMQEPGNAHRSTSVIARLCSVSMSGTRCARDELFEASVRTTVAARVL